MRSDIVYVSGVGGDAYRLNDGIYVGRPSDIFSREWSYSVGYASVSSVTRKARTARLKAFFADVMKADAFRRACDRDVSRGVAGTLSVDGWSQRCMVMESAADKVSEGFFTAELTVVLLDGVWRKGHTDSFELLTATAGEAIMTHRLKGFEPWTGEIEMRVNGSIISGETGTAYAYSIDKLQDRGRFFISPMEQVYEGQVIGEHTRQNDITVNVTKAKQLTNMRASGSDEKTSIAPPKVFSLEEALEYIKEDEYVEVTPHAMRLRKILLNETDRKRASK